MVILSGKLCFQPGERKLSVLTCGSGLMVHEEEEKLEVWSVFGRVVERLTDYAHLLDFWNIQVRP